MNTKIALLFFFLLSVCQMNAQVIKGEVVSTEGVPVEGATVVMQTLDSLFVEGVCTDSLGIFSLKSDIEAYRLIVQHILYETNEQVYKREKNLVIQLKERSNDLSEVVVKGERQVVKLVDGKISYDLPHILEGKVVSNIYESLLHLPGVREQNGSLLLAGSTGVTILINGQMTSMPTENLIAALKMLPYDRIQSAEIMYSTPPQYHIRGAAINVVLKEEGTGDGQTEKLQGQANTAYTQKHYGNYTAGGSLQYTSANFSMDLNYSYDLNKERSGMDIFSKHQLKNGSVTDIEQSNRGNKKANEHNIRTSLGYKLSENSNISATYTSQIVTGMNNNEFSWGTLSNSVNHKNNVKPVQMHNLAFNYTSGLGLKAGVEYTRYKSCIGQHFSEYMESDKNEFTADAGQYIDRYRFFVDQSHRLASWTLNYGGQFMYAKDHSSQLYNSMIGEDMTAINMNSCLKEYTGNLYIGFEKNIGNKLSLSASITGEYYHFADTKEWNVFPALEATYMISPGHIMQLSFSSDKVYPSYWEMHGGTSYLNSYAEIHGNPYLNPYKNYSGQLNYIFKGKYVLTAYYNRQKDYFVQLPYQSADRLVLLYQTLNLDYKQVVGLNLIIPFNAGNVLDSRLTLNGFYDKVKASHFHDISFNNDNWVFFAQLDNTINISSKPNIKLEITGSYITENIQGPSTLSALWKVDAGLKWTFCKDMAELRLKGSDLFNSWMPDMTMRYASQNLKMNMIPDSRAVSLSFVWRFGGYKDSGKKLDSSRFGIK